jgi:hypothetical protein
MQHALMALVGYDVSLLRRLPEAEQRHIARVAEAWLLSCALLASPPAYAAWLIEHKLWLAVAMGAFTFVMVLNLVRLGSAGGGAATHLDEDAARAYRPALGPSAVVGLLALLFAQPAQLPLWNAELAAPVAAERTRLAAQHEAALASLGVADGGAYAAELARCDFLVLRLTTMWRHAPTRALQLTGLYVLAVLLPALWARVVARASLREYALARWRRDRRGIVRATRAAEREADALLRRFPSYTPSAPVFADPPFNTRVASPLLLPARAPAQPVARSFWRRWSVRP